MRNYRKVENAPKLADIMPRYDGTVVRIGTDGSGYYVCGEWSETLLKDMEWWEEEKKRLKASIIERYKNEVAMARKNLPKLMKKLPKLEEEADTAIKEEQIFMEQIGHISTLRERRKHELQNVCNEHLNKKTAIFEESIKDLTPKEKKSARIYFAADVRKIKKKFDKALKKYIIYLDKSSVQDAKKMDMVMARTEKATESLDYLRKQIGLAKAKIETYPGKIRDYTRYLQTYTPFMDRNVREIYDSEIHPGEVSIIIQGREPGPFWDCSEYNRWKKTGVLQRD